ncbi:uncharacterized protein JCM6883_004856 [Sporobolomyces salmoneus]|uniref:uncharacterized protein n=1 Tax=Sporobolomyces salmoneus TaxID=183962 RepID=UPI00316E6D18
MNRDDTGCTRVAVIGSGLAGLTAAHLLAVVPSDVQVHVFEKSEELGMDNSSISIKGEKGSYRIDVPMRSINTGSHGRVKNLYDYLKVPLVKNEFSYSFSRLSSAPSPPPRSSTPTRQPPTASSSGLSTRVPTPLPPYSEAPISRRSLSPNSRKTSRPSSPSPPPPFPSTTTATSTTTFLYEGSSGLRWPPVSIPSSLSSTNTSSLPALIRSTWSQSKYLVRLIFLAISYFHILFLSFFYVKLGLTQTRESIHLPLIGRIENVGTESLENWGQRHGVRKEMMQGVLEPLMAAVCTVGVEEARGMPVGEALEYITSTFLSAHYTTSPSFGVRGIVRRLIAPVQVSNIYLSSNISEIVYNSDEDEGRTYTIKYKIGAGDAQRDEVEGEELEVDYIIFATQANQAASLLETLSTSRDGGPSDDLKETIEALNSFRYVQALVVNHTDQSFLPPSPLDRRDLNLAAYDSDYQHQHVQDEDDEGIWTTHLPRSSVETTHIVTTSSPRSSSVPSSSSTPTILQTTNPLRPIPAEKILSSNWFSRAFVTPSSKKVLPRFLLDRTSQSQSPSLQGLLLGSPDSEGTGQQRRGGGGGIYFTGSWCERGIPLLEGCVTSAENVVRDLLEREGRRARRSGKEDWPF